MHKGKDGKVTASLTEVKNKTGDIFDLVDEYGEVTLTSYNKARYKITKIDISEILEKKTVKKPAKKAPKAKAKKVTTIEVPPKPVANVAPAAEAIKKAEEEVKVLADVKVEPVTDAPRVIKPEPAATPASIKEDPEVEVVEASAKETEFENKFSNMDVWDKNNSKELEHVKTMTSNLL